MEVAPNDWKWPPMTGSGPPMTGSGPPMTGSGPPVTMATHSTNKKQRKYEKQIFVGLRARDRYWRLTSENKKMASVKIVMSSKEKRINKRSVWAAPLKILG
jgi:hypothetical protein